MLPLPIKVIVVRTPKYISPTSLSSWLKDREEFYLNYLADVRPPKFPQTLAMSVGSAFDAYVKSYLHQTLFGTGHVNAPQFKLDVIFEQQVESQNRDWAREAGQHCFNKYKDSGALSDLMIEMQNAQTEPRFEFSVEGLVQNNYAPEGVILSGKPDCYFIAKSGSKVILDWKVNGYCSYASPKAGYIKLRETTCGMKSSKHNCAHKDAMPMLINGVMINAAKNMELTDESWATQLAIYAWLLGAEVGDPTIIGAIDQLACDGKVGIPTIRVANHRAMIGKDFQIKMFGECLQLWDVIHSDYIFRDKTPEQSKELCDMLDAKARLLVAPKDEKSAWLASISR